MDIEKQVNQIVQSILSDILEQAQAQVAEVIQTQVAAAVAKINIVALFNASFAASLKNQTFEFPDESIPGHALDLPTIQLSGNNIVGGIIKQFGSTGIDDKATDCKLTILDDVTVVENNLVTQDLTVKGSTTIEGDLIVTGRVPENSAMYIELVNTVTNNVRTSLDQVVFTNYADMVLAQIKDHGLDLNKITINGQEIVNTDALGEFITSSSLQKVGTLKDLQVSGESFLAQTLYTTSKRVGINTIEPTRALSIWDQEVEFGFGKQETGVAIIETPRNNSLVISTNRKNNLNLLPDGSVTMQKINLGSIGLSSSDTPPSYNSPKGSIVFNANPSMGGPLGWVSLGNANWANFGFID